MPKATISQHHLKKLRTSEWGSWHHVYTESFQIGLQEETSVLFFGSCANHKVSPQVSPEYSNLLTVEWLSIFLNPEKWYLKRASFQVVIC